MLMPCWVQLPCRVLAGWGMCAAQGGEEGNVATAPAQPRHQTELFANNPGVRVEPVKAMAPCEADTVQGTRFCPSCLSRAMWLWSCFWQQHEGLPCTSV